MHSAILEAKAGVGAQPDAQVQITRRSATGARAALAGKSDSLSVRDAGGQVDGEGPNETLSGPPAAASSSESSSSAS
jgi:hypothetical protein